MFLQQRTEKKKVLSLAFLILSLSPAPLRKEEMGIIEGVETESISVCRTATRTNTFILML